MLRLWNVGVKAQDLNTEIEFLEKVGARLLLRETLETPEGTAKYAFLEIGGTRVFVTPKPVFEDKLTGQLMPGLAHIVFETDDLDREFKRIAALGTEVLIEPMEISAGFGSRRISFFRSPNGLVFEVMQILEDKL